VRQQAQSALAAVASVLEAERAKLIERAAAGAPLLPEREIAPAPAGAAGEGAFRLGETAGPALFDRYEEARLLARQGLGTRRIAEELNLPRGEVELAVKLRPALM
jgi:hypothetical protein